MHTLRFLPLDTGRLGGGTSTHPNPAVRGWAWVQPWISTARLWQLIYHYINVVGLTPKNAAENMMPHWFVMECSQGQATLHATCDSHSKSWEFFWFSLHSKMIRNDWQLAQNPMGWQYQNRPACRFFWRNWVRTLNKLLRAGIGDAWRLPRLPGAKMSDGHESLGDIRVYIYI